MAEKNQEIYSLIVPMKGKSILIPNKALAEIVPFIDSEPAPADHQPWHLGFLNWRSNRLPVISYEHVYDETFPPMERRVKMVAIINTQMGLKDHPYFGISVEGIPRLGLVSKEAIGHRDPKIIQKLPSVIAADVIYKNKEMLIPDVMELEKLIQTHQI
ncbi:MAG: hypothetical protein GY781_03655 [Gammaproteobacteria bacterium]|nr:hypothetical protein [Gammaproteobacteria bacterium]